MTKKKTGKTENVAELPPKIVVSDLVTPAMLAEMAAAPGPGDNPLRVLSLFSGCGGMDAGFEGWFIAPRRSFPVGSPLVVRNIGDDWALVRKTRFTTVFANDILPEARAGWLGYMSRFGHGEDIFSNVSVVDLVKAHNEGNEVFPRDIDVVTGGFPCQDFSVAGKRLGFESHKNHLGKKRDGDDIGQPSEESRGKLYFWMKQVIDATRPKVFIAENVKGLVNLKDVKEIIQRDFSNASNGYIVLDPQVLHAADYGVPESRERVIFIGLRRDALRPEALAALEADEIPPMYNPYPRPTHSRDGNPAFCPAVTTAEVLASLPEPDESADRSQQTYSKAKFMSNGSQGQVEIKLDRPGPTIRSEHHGNIEFRRLSAEHGGRHTEELAAGRSERRLTPRECALIQTFPPDFPFVRTSPLFPGGAMSASGAYKVIGNAVPPVLAYNIASRLQELWPLLF